jgi:formylglycine-generating enzyme required for sulfatase activity
VYLDAYFIGKYEVTNAEYMEFVKATGRPMPAHWVANSRNMPEGIENHPVYRVSWEDAKAYCDWCGKRLPTEAEWEKAATWDMKRRAKRVCPWGDDLDPRMANNCYQTGCRCNGDSKVHSQWRGKWSKSEEGKKILALGGNTSPVGGVKGDRSFFNCFDMAGNVREWIADWYGADYYTVSPSKNPTGPSAEEATLVNYYSIKNEKCRVARGVFWFEYFKGWRGSLRYFAIPTERGSGFRCAADYPWEPTEKAEGEKERRGEGATGRGGETAETAKPPTQSSALSPQSYDDVYVTAAATGEKIPHPLSKKTYNLRYLGRTIKGPEGMVYVPAGTFTMGEGESEHKVYLDAYFIGKYEVTNAEWKAFLDATEYKVLPSHWKGRDFPQGTDAHPVAYVAWVDAHMYCDWVSTETGRVVRLPTEAQWEKAARGPKGFTYPWGNNWDPKLCNGPWLCASKCGLKVNPDGSVPQWDAFVKSEKWKEVGAAGGYTTAIGSYPQGKSFYGCHDLAGNVFEWCADWSKTDYYKLKDAKKNPQGPDEEDAELCEFSGRKSKARLTRGGSWQHEASFCRSISRCRDLPTRRSNSLGFRVVVLPSGTP